MSTDPEEQPPYPDGDEEETLLPEEAEPSTRKGKRKKREHGRAHGALRKCPTAPKRFKSSYICFFSAKQPEIKIELGEKATVAEVSKRSAEMWRNLSAEERAHWDDVAAKDKQRYMVEKATYTGPWQVPWKRAKKDPSAPKRPMSAFLYFSQDRRRLLKDQHPNLKNTEVSKMLGHMWQNAPESEREPHIQKEREEREKYKIAIAGWREENAKKLEEQKKHQAEHHAYVSSLYNTSGHAAVDARDPAAMHPYHAVDPSHAYHYGGYPPTHHVYPPTTAAYPPHVNPYSYANGKHVAVLAPNGMPVYPASYQVATQPAAAVAYPETAGASPAPYAEAGVAAPAPTTEEIYGETYATTASAPPVEDGAGDGGHDL